MALSDQEKSLRKEARKRSTERAAERRTEAAASAEEAKHAARFNTRSTRRSVANAERNAALTLEEYRVAEARGLVGPCRTPDSRPAGTVQLFGDWGYEIGGDSAEALHRQRPVSLPSERYADLADEIGRDGPVPEEPEERYPAANTTAYIDYEDEPDKYDDDRWSPDYGAELLNDESNEDEWRPDDRYDEMSHSYDYAVDDDPEWEAAADLDAEEWQTHS